MKTHTQNLPTFQFDKFRLRPVASHDAKVIYEFNSKMEHLNHIARTPYTDMAQADAHLDRYLRGMEMGNMAWWCFDDLETKYSFGYIGLFGIDPEGHAAELGYGIIKEYWGKGMVSEAVQKVVEYAKQELKIHRLHAVVDEGNTASMKILEKSDFQQEGLLRDLEYAHDKYFSMYMYALI